jgi:hypothetical protein
MFHKFCQTLFIASRSYWVQTLTLVQLERLANSLLELAILMQVLCWALGSCCSRSIDALLSFGNYAVILLCSIYTCPHFTNFCYARMILIFIFKVFQRCLYFSN